MSSDVTSVSVGDVLDVHDDVLDQLTRLAQYAERFAPEHAARHLRNYAANHSNTVNSYILSRREH